MKNTTIWSLALMAFVLLANPRGAMACPNSPDDESIIEYFNQIEFSEDIYIIIQDTGEQFKLLLSCPPQESPYFPPSDFLLTLTLTTGQDQITCNSGTIVLNKIDMPANPACKNDGRVCDFIVTVSNRATEAIYSSTELEVTFTNGDNTYIPNLNPATLPLCPESFNPCILSGSCTLSSNKSGAIQLCESAAATSCTAPPATRTYSYNENVYFQTAIISKIGGER